MFAAGAALSDPDLQQLIRHHLDVCRQPRREQQRRVAHQAAQMAASGAFDGVVHHNASYASLSSHLWELDHLQLASLYDGDSAAGDAAAASAAAAAVAAAAAASSNSMCSYTTSYTSTQHDAGSAAAAAAVNSSSSKVGELGAADMRHLTVEGSVAAARAVLHPQRLPQLLGLLPEVLAPQRVAVGLALLDSALRIGEHEVTMGPSCELQGVKNTEKNAGSSSRSMASCSKQDAEVTDQVSGSGPGQQVSDVACDSSRQSMLLSQMPLLLTLPRAVPQLVLDAGAAAAADVVSAPGSRQQLLHAVDTVLAMLTVGAAAVAKSEQAQQLQQQQIAATDVTSGNALTRASAAVTAAFTAAQMAVSHPDTGVLGTPVVAAAAAGVAAAVAEARSVVASAAATRPKAVSDKLHQAAAVASCALGNPHSCLEVEEAAAQQQQQQGYGSSSSSRSSNAELLATLVGLHVSLAGDLWGLWWAYHANVALRLRMQQA
jgi:hypothetical protein